MNVDTIKKKLQELIYVIEGHVVCIRQLMQNLQYPDNTTMDDFDDLTNVIRLDELRMSMLLLSLNNENSVSDDVLSYALYLLHSACMIAMNALFGPAVYVLWTDDGKRSKRKESINDI